MLRFQMQVTPEFWRDIGSTEVDEDGVGKVGATILELVESQGRPFAQGEYRFRPLDGCEDDWTRLIIDTAWAGRPTNAPQSQFPIAPLG